MATAAEIFAKVQDLIAKGDISGAQTAMLEKPSDLAAAEAAAAAAAPPPPPRKPEEVLLDLFRGFNNILGNHAAITPMINELAEVFELAAKPPAA